MLIAAMTDSDGIDAIVSDDFASAKYLLILDADNESLLASFPHAGASDCDLARKIVECDCEAVLCGPIEEEPFVIIADEGCVTRYQASGHRVMEALHMMNAYQLELITTFIGGEDCDSSNGNGCNCGQDDE